jgi:hypothetical protein
MGNTRFRSDVREQGARTASFSTIAAGTISGNLTVSGNNTYSGTAAFSSTVAVTGLTTATGGVSIPATSYLKLGSIYVVTAAAASVSGFTNATVNALASTALTGVVSTKGDIPRGTIFINASSNAVASNIMLGKVGLASWTGLGPSGSMIQD